MGHVLVDDISGEFAFTKDFNVLRKFYETGLLSSASKFIGQNNRKMELQEDNDPLL